jgi:hypothetical protein
MEYLIGGSIGFVVGFFLCMFLSLTIVFYQRYKEKKDVSSNG